MKLQVSFAGTELENVFFFTVLKTGMSIWKFCFASII